MPRTLYDDFPPTRIIPVPAWRRFLARYVRHLPVIGRRLDWWLWTWRIEGF